eukprot:Lankesteria_metandrocarpae@DN4895_c0_g1_i2.p1
MSSVAGQRTRGALIVFEGIDRSGKTTQTKLLTDALQQDGVSCRSVRFPDRSTPIGSLLNTYLTSVDTHLPHEACNLLFAANRWELMYCRAAAVTHPNLQSINCTSTDFY